MWVWNFFAHSDCSCSFLFQAEYPNWATCNLWLRYFFFASFSQSPSPILSQNYDCASTFAYLFCRQQTCSPFFEVDVKSKDSLRLKPFQTSQQILLDGPTGCRKKILLCFRGQGGSVEKQRIQTYQTSCWDLDLREAENQESFRVLLPPSPSIFVSMAQLR